jgi:hypothetical protein
VPILRQSGNNGSMVAVAGKLADVVDVLHNVGDRRTLVGAYVTVRKNTSRHYSLRIRGSRASRRPSPTKLNPSTVIKIASPGKVVSQGAKAI